MKALKGQSFHFTTEGRSWKIGELRRFEGAIELGNKRAIAVEEERDDSPIFGVPKIRKSTSEEKVDRGN